jgi:Ni/Fe-hydrogenase subunit HybB-like protein
MQQMVLIVGVVLASSLGLALLARVLATAFRNSRTAWRSKSMSPPFIQEAIVFNESYLIQATRGYDTPELYRQDELLRSQFPSHNSPDDLF